MSNLAKDWQEGDYSIRVTGNTVMVGTIRYEKMKEPYGNYLGDKKIIATAKCDPEDEFSLSMGVALAMDRLNKKLSKSKIEVGDKVKIVSKGFVYTTYVDWVVDNVPDLRMAACFVYGQIPNEDDTVYVVKAIAPHGGVCNTKKLAYVQKYSEYYFGTVDTNQPCYLINVNGLEKV